MATLASGASVTFPIAVDQVLTFTASTATGRAVLSAQKGGDVVFDFKNEAFNNTPIFSPGSSGIVTITSTLNPITYAVSNSQFPAYATDSSGNVTGLVGPSGVKYPVNNRNTLRANVAATTLADYSTGSVVYNGGASSDSTQIFLGSATQKIPHNASAGASRFDWTHPTSWTAGYVYGFWYRNPGANTLQVEVLAAVTGFTSYTETAVALPPTGNAWRLVVFGQEKSFVGGTVTLGSTALNVFRVREAINTPWSAGDFINVGPIYSGFPSRAFAMIHFDDCNQNVYTNGLPILSDYRIKGTVNVITNLIGSTYLGNPTFTLAQLQDVYNNYGWDVCSHTLSHPQVQSAAIAPSSVVDNLDNTATVTVTTDGNGYPGHGLVGTTNPNGIQVVMSGFTPSNFNNGAAVATVISPTQFKYPITSGSGPVTVMGTWNPAYTSHGLRNLSSYAAKYAEIKGAQDYLISAGFSRSARFLAYPQGGYDVDTIAACKSAGVLLARGTYESIFYPADVVSGMSYSYGATLTRSNLPSIPPYQTGIEVPAAQAIDTSQTFAQIKAEIDRAVATGAVWVGLTHSISGTRGTSGNNAYQLEQVCQYLSHLRNQGLIDVGTMSDYYDRLTSMNSW